MRGFMHVCYSVCVESEDNLWGSVFSLPYILQRIRSLGLQLYPLNHLASLSLKNKNKKKKPLKL